MFVKFCGTLCLGDSLFFAKLSADQSQSRNWVGLVGKELKSKKVKKVSGSW